MADWLFNGAERVIKEPPGVGNTFFEVERDIYSSWKRWLLNGGAQFQPAMIIEGGTPIGDTGTFTGKTVVLTNGWKLQAADHDHQTTINGNLYSDDGIVSVPTVGASATIFITASSSAQGIATAAAPVNANTITAIAQAIWGYNIDA